MDHFERLEFLERFNNKEGALYSSAPQNEHDIIWEGSDTEQTAEEVRAKHCRYESQANRYLRGYIPVLQSASLRGPLDAGWVNPWRYRSSEVAVSGRKKGHKGGNRAHSINALQPEHNGTVSTIAHAAANPILEVSSCPFPSDGKNDKAIGTSDCETSDSGGGFSVEDSWRSDLEEERGLPRPTPPQMVVLEDNAINSDPFSLNHGTLDSYGHTNPYRIHGISHDEGKVRKKRPADRQWLKSSYVSKRARRDSPATSSPTPVRQYGAEESKERMRTKNLLPSLAVFRSTKSKPSITSEHDAQQIDSVSRLNEVEQPPSSSLNNSIELFRNVNSEKLRSIRSSGHLELQTPFLSDHTSTSSKLDETSPTTLPRLLRTQNEPRTISQSMGDTSFVTEVAPSSRDLENFRFKKKKKKSKQKQGPLTREGGEDDNAIVVQSAFGDQDSDLKIFVSHEEGVKTRPESMLPYKIHSIEIRPIDRSHDKMLIDEIRLVIISSIELPSTEMPSIKMHPVPLEDSLVRPLETPSGSRVDMLPSNVYFLPSMGKTALPIFDFERNEAKDYKLFDAILNRSTQSEHDRMILDKTVARVSMRDANRKILGDSQPHLESNTDLVPQRIGGGSNVSTYSPLTGYITSTEPNESSTPRDDIIGSFLLKDQQLSVEQDQAPPLPSLPMSTQTSKKSQSKGSIFEASLMPPIEKEACQHGTVSLSSCIEIQPSAPSESLPSTIRQSSKLESSASRLISRRGGTLHGETSESQNKPQEQRSLARLEELGVSPHLRTSFASGSTFCKNAIDKIIEADNSTQTCNTTPMRSFPSLAEISPVRSRTRECEDALEILHRGSEPLVVEHDYEDNRTLGSLIPPAGTEIYHDADITMGGRHPKRGILSREEVSHVHDQVALDMDQINSSPSGGSSPRKTASGSCCTPYVAPMDITPHESPPSRDIKLASDSASRCATKLMVESSCVNFGPADSESNETGSPVIEDQESWKDCTPQSPWIADDQPPIPHLVSEKRSEMIPLELGQEGSRQNFSNDKPDLSSNGKPFTPRYGIQFLKSLMASTPKTPTPNIGVASPEPNNFAKPDSRSEGKGSSITDSSPRGREDVRADAIVAVKQNSPTSDHFGIKPFSEIISRSSSPQPMHHEITSNDMPSTQLLTEAALRNPWASAIKSTSSKKLKKRVSWVLAEDEIDSGVLLMPSCLNRQESPPPPEQVDEEEITDNSFEKHFIAARGAKRVKSGKAKGSLYSSSPLVDAITKAFVTADQTLIQDSKIPDMKSQALATSNGSKGNARPSQTHLLFSDSTCPRSAMVTDASQTINYDMSDSLNDFLADNGGILEEWSVEAELKKSREAELNLAASKEGKRRGVYGSFRIW